MLQQSQSKVFILDGEVICKECRVSVFDGCDHDHGERLCEGCGEWTYPFYYDLDDGCQHCGSISFGVDNQQR